MAKQPIPFSEGMERAGGLWSMLERFGMIKTILSSVVATAFTWASATLQQLPRAFLLGIIWTAAAACSFVAFTLIVASWTVGSRKLKEWTSESPLKKRLEALELQIGKRQITTQQQETMKDRLAGMPGKIRIVSLWGDDDSTDYAEQFSQLLSSVGWSVWGVEKAYEYRLQGTEIA